MALTSIIIIGSADNLGNNISENGGSFLYKNNDSSKQGLDVLVFVYSESAIENLESILNRHQSSVWERIQRK